MAHRHRYHDRRPVPDANAISNAFTEQWRRLATTSVSASTFNSHAITNATSNSHTITVATSLADTYTIGSTAPYADAHGNGNGDNPASGFADPKSDAGGAEPQPLDPHAS